MMIMGGIRTRLLLPQDENRVRARLLVISCRYFSYRIPELFLEALTNEIQCSVANNSMKPQSSHLYQKLNNHDASRHSVDKLNVEASAN